jgi:hypothetical protein
VHDRSSDKEIHKLSHKYLIIFSVLLYFVLSFLDIATMDPDPCPSDIKNSDIGKYIFNQPSN